MNRRIAFTLAEILITLGIIGVAAAMTLPALIANYQKKCWNSRQNKLIHYSAEFLTKWLLMKR